MVAAAISAAGVLAVTGVLVGVLAVSVKRWLVKRSE